MSTNTNILLAKDFFFGESHISVTNYHVLNFYNSKHLLFQTWLLWKYCWPIFFPQDGNMTYKTDSWRFLSTVNYTEIKFCYKSILKYKVNLKIYIWRLKWRTSCSAYFDKYFGSQGRVHLKKNRKSLL